MTTRNTLTPEQVDQVTGLIANGASMSDAGAAVGVGRNSVSSLLFRLRAARDPRVAPAGPSPAVTKAAQRDAIADAFAEGAYDLRIASDLAGLTLAIATQRWTEIRSALGSQAR